MMGFVQCDGCGLTGTFPLELKIEYRSERCAACRHSQESVYTFFFCATECLSKWTVEHSSNGVLFLPCRSCRKTGNAFGFESNGACKNCDGQGAIEIPHSNAANAANTARIEQMQAECDAANRARARATRVT